MILLLVMTVLAQVPAAGAEHTLGEEEIVGEATITITDRKPVHIPSLDLFLPIQNLLQSESYIFDEALARSMDLLTTPAVAISSPYLRVPVEERFISGDIMTFLSHFDRQVASWEFEVANSLGQPVRRVARRGQPPYIIYWDGRTDTGEPIATGEVYSFIFTAQDAVGNRTRLQGMPRRVDAMVFRSDGEVLISIAADSIFQDGASRLLDDAGPRLDEAANIIRETFRREVGISVYTEEERLSTDRCNTMRTEFARRLVLPDGALSVTPRFVPGLQPKSSRVEIRIR